MERCQRRLKGAFRARLAGPDWHLHLPWVLMGLRAAPTEDTGVSAAEIVFGALLVLPGQILDAEEPPPADFITKLWQFGRLPPSCPLSFGRWRPSRRRRCYQRYSCTSARAAQFPPCRVWRNHQKTIADEKMSQTKPHASVPLPPPPAKSNGECFWRVFHVVIQNPPNRAG